MKTWCAKALAGIFFAAMAFVGGDANGADPRQGILNRAQERLWLWDVDGATKVSQEMLRLDPEGDASFYLAGVVAFYRGDYRQAKDFFGRIKDLEAFENSNEGLLALTNEILAQNVTFQESRSSHAVVHYAPGIDEVMVETIQQGMEAIRREIGHDLGVTPPEAVLIEIYPTANSFIAASPLTESDVKTSGTIALCKYGRVLLTTPRSLLRGYPWMDTLSHEYVHYALTRRWGSNIPVWLHEGIAKYLEARWREKEAGTLSPSAEALLAEALRKKDFVTFQEMHPSFAKLPSARRAQLAYAQVQTLVEYLVKERGGWPTVHALLDHLAKGLEDEPALEKATGRSLPALLADWQKWLAKKNLRDRDLDLQSLEVVDTAPNEEVLARKDLAQVRTPSAREHVHLGDLLRQRGRMKAAVLEYEKARTLAKPLSPVIATKLGRTYLSLKDLGRAEKILREVVILYPDQGLAWQLLGDLERERKNHALAAAAYERAIEINPFNPQIHAHLARLYDLLGRRVEEKRARRALEILTR